VALLRGVNIGRARRVPMAVLRDLLTELGCTQVRTLLNSGNAVFSRAGGTARSHAEAIAGAITQRLAIEVPVVVLAAHDLAEIVRENPLEAVATDPARLLVAFTQDAADLSALRALEPLVAPAEAFAVGQRAAYLYCANGILQSRAGEALLGRLGRSATTRNWVTTRKLQALASGDG
jgi:uncharacterized protein (DUF1697 family)